EGHSPEHRLELARALVYEEHLVGLAVTVEALGLLDGLADPHLDVAVEHQHPAAEDRVAAGLERSRVRQPVDMRIRNPLLELDRLEAAHFRDAARRMEVVEDR